MIDDFPFTRKIQLMAEQEASKFKDEVFGVKCWFGDARHIENGAPVALVGINPGGGPGDALSDRKSGNLELPYTQRGFNAWLDEQWSGNGPSHQAALQRAYKIMFGNKWESTLRQSACFNFSPFRTPSEAALPAKLRTLSDGWFIDILRQASPKLIICEGRAPWQALVKRGATILREEHAYNVAWVREATLKGVLPRTVRVIGLPHLSRFRGERIFEVLARFATE